MYVSELLLILGFLRIDFSKLVQDSDLCISLLHLYAFNLTGNMSDDVVVFSSSLSGIEERVDQWKTTCDIL